MPSLSRSALLPHPGPCVYEIVSDVARYSEFLPWCLSSTIVEQTETSVTATLEFGVRGMRERVTTRNTLMSGERIGLELVSGPFQQFSGQWDFVPLGGATGCKVEFNLSYQIVTRHAILGKAFIGHATDKLVDAFTKRCGELLD